MALWLKLPSMFVRANCYAILLAIIILAGCSGSGVIILNSVSQDIGNNVLLLLGQNNIHATKTLKKDGTYDVYVPSREQIQALAILKANGQPMRSFASLGQVFKKDGFISSPLEEQSRFIYALDEQISDMLSQFDGVISVHTEVSLPAPSDNLWQIETIQPSAAVLIKYKQGYRLDLYSNRIKQLVMNAVPGLSQNKVTVLLLPVSGI